MAKSQRQLIGEIHTVLLGVEGTADRGLVGTVEEVVKTQAEQGKCMSKIKRNFWMLVAFLIGSGVLSASLVAALV